MNSTSASLFWFQMNNSTPCHNKSSCCIGKHADVCANSFICCSGKFSKTSDIGMYGTSKLYLVMMTQALQQRLQVSRNCNISWSTKSHIHSKTSTRSLAPKDKHPASVQQTLSGMVLQRAMFTSAFKPWCLMSHHQLYTQPSKYHSFCYSVLKQLFCHFAAYKVANEYAYHVHYALNCLTLGCVCERERGFYIFSQPTRLYTCPRVVSDLEKNIGTKRLSCLIV